MRGHILVCGDDPLGLRIIEQLRAAGHEIAIITTSAQLSEAGIADASALICADDDDALNLEIALLARQLNAAKTRTDLLLRIADTPAQHGLKRAQRLTALNAAFAVDPLQLSAVQAARIVLVDDVMTTGASLFTTARVLKSAGAAHVTGLVIARTE